MNKLAPLRVGEWLVTHSPAEHWPLQVTVKARGDGGEYTFRNPTHALGEQPGYLPAEAAIAFYTHHNIKKEDG